MLQVEHAQVWLAFYGLSRYMVSSHCPLTALSMLLKVISCVTGSATCPLSALKLLTTAVSGRNHPPVKGGEICDFE